MPLNYEDADHVLNKEQEVLLGELLRLINDSEETSVVKVLVRLQRFVRRCYEAGAAQYLPLADAVDRARSKILKRDYKELRDLRTLYEEKYVLLPRPHRLTSPDASPKPTSKGSD